MIELLLPCGFDTQEYSWMKAIIGICTLADYSVAKKYQQIPSALTLLNTLAKQKLKWRQHLVGRPRRWDRPTPLWLGWARTLCHVIPSCHIIYDYALFWTY
jgi:hypothetical protein